MSTGIGYDIHKLVPGRPLILGGVRIPHDKGLLGHSDADALVHAIIDSLLGAAGLGDIGLHFPDTDPAYKDADSLDLLKKAWGKIRNLNMEIVNIDAVIIAQEPKMAPHIEKMKANISEVLGIKTFSVNIKATTNEGLGPIGRGEGIAAQAICQLS
jgi:2-C-methyl-D-erythritol 2,4-cyclodiphosphate synthase